MYISGVKAEILGTIREKPTIVMVGEKRVANVIVTYTEGYGDKSQLKNAECSFWQTDAGSIAKYPVGHTIVVSGILTTEGYVNENNVPSVKVKINVRDWRSCQKLVKTENEAQTVQKTEQAEPQPQNKTQQIPPRKQLSAEDEFLIKSLDTILTFGPYNGMKVKEVIKKDIQYIYKMAQEATNEKWKKVFIVTYNHAYNCWQQKQKTTIQGNTAKGKPHMVTTTPDGDLPF